MAKVTIMDVNSLTCVDAIDSFNRGLTALINLSSYEKEFYHASCVQFER